MSTDSQEARHVNHEIFPSRLSSAVLNVLDGSFRMQEERWQKDLSGRYAKKDHAPLAAGELSQIPESPYLGRSYRFHYPFAVAGKAPRLLERT